MDYTFIVESFRKEDCTLKVKYSTSGLKSRRAFVRVPADVLTRQDPWEIRKYIILKAPISAWEEELKVKDETPEAELIGMLGQPQVPVTTEEHETTLSTGFSPEVEDGTTYTVVEVV